jgi:FAD/FMN-containing dehydrogenase/Fe-S oxidoreductase
MQEKTIRALGAAACEVRFDDLARQMYATDASIHQIVPEAVAFPRTAAQAASVLAAAAAESVPVTPRGAGTGLCGGALGEGLVVELARYNRGITAFNLEARTVRVGAGVVLDQLNAFLAPHGLTFGPDVATSSRATLGGMIANNSSGARAPLYRATVDHVRSLEIVLGDGRIVEVGAEKGGLRECLDAVDRLVLPHAEEIRGRFHREIPKRWPGYGLDRYLESPGDISKLIGGSEGTLAAIFSAELDLVPVVKEKGLGLIFFDSVDEAMQATVELLDLAPAAVENIDSVLFNQTRGQLAFRSARDLLELDAKPSKSILIVEFYGEVEAKLAGLSQRKLGLRTLVFRDAREMTHIWNLRKAGLTLLTGMPGPAKPVAGIEDAAIPPAHLPEYVRGLESLLTPLGLDASFYGHAASGLLHVRPVLDLHRAEDIAKFRTIAEGVAALVRQFRGSLTAEHGVGVAHTEFVEDQIGAGLLTAMRGIKDLLDPANQMNPGKIFDNGRYKIDGDLRQGAGACIEPPFEPRLAFAAKDHSFVGNLEQCNGCGGCRKDAPTMCPTFIATGDEVMSTRGRANVIRAVLEGRLSAGSPPLLSPELDVAISNCLSCKACTTECPSNVNMALLKAELLYARLRTHGIPLGTRLISRVDLLGRMASVTPRLANASLKWRWFRALLEKATGLSARRPLPGYALEPFDRWFRRRRGAAPKAAPRGRVLLWDDCFVRYNEPHIGMAAVKVLEAAGYEVALLEGRACCGRPAFSMGRLDVAEAFGRQNLALLEDRAEPIVFLEPSCYSMFHEDYRELKIPGAEAVADRVFLFEDFIDRLLEASPDALCFEEAAFGTAIHAHCHAKALTDASVMPRLAGRIPKHRVQLLDTGCCGMAGAFGAMESKYDLSVQVAQDLLDKVKALPAGTRLVASGTSCRHQLEHLAAIRPWHMAELLAESLTNKGDGSG